MYKLSCLVVLMLLMGGLLIALPTTDAAPKKCEPKSAQAFSRCPTATPTRTSTLVPTVTRTPSATYFAQGLPLTYGCLMVAINTNTVPQTAVWRCRESNGELYTVVLVVGYVPTPMR